MDRRPTRADVTLTTVAETLLFGAEIGWVDLEWIQVRYIAGVLPNVIEFRDRLGGELTFAVATRVGAEDTFREFVHRIAQQRGRAPWSVKLTIAGTTMQIVAQAKIQGSKD